jgi:hypothetical protein
LYFGTGDGKVGSREVAERVGHAEQFGHGGGAHLLHHGGAVRLDGALGRAQEAGDLLVESAGDDEAEDLPCAGR